MKTTINLRPFQYFILFFLILGFSSAFAQLTLSPIPRNTNTKNSSSARTQGTPKKLPFWDDFSFPKENGDVQDSLWLYGESVFANTGMAINPPSIGVATFDGLDSLGKPYSINDVLAKGYADKLVSVPLHTNLIDPSLRPNVFLSFYYQFQGKGEPPNPGDILTLLFKNNLGKWETIWTVNNDGTLEKDVFHKILIPVTDSRFFHEGFQFMFKNFARLSGPYDTWNLDYVFLSNGEVSTKPLPFPDRTITSTLSSLFKDYTAMPIKHFMTNPNNFIIKPSISISNLREDSEGQPLSYFLGATISSFKNKIASNSTYVFGDSLHVEGNALLYNETKKIELEKIPTPAMFDVDADSIFVNLKVVLNSGDNVVQSLNKGDYVPRVYSPVDFRLNDKTSATFQLSNYYAYDDGTAEYGAGLNQAGAQMMYRFDLQTAKLDTIIGFKVYFPSFGDESSQILQVKILRDLDGNPASLLYQQAVTVQRTQQNNFIYIKFARYVGVDKTFYLGWQQNSSAKINVGLDKNTDSSSKIYYNVNGTWAQDPDFKGSLMIRPIFGRGGVVVGIPENTSDKGLYPNPNNGSFFISNNTVHIKVIDITGREIPFSEEATGDEKRINLETNSPGIYIIRYLIGDSVYTKKIIVQQ